MSACEHRTRIPSPAVTVADSLPTGTDETVLILPVVSAGEDSEAAAVVAATEPALPTEAVAEIEAALQALGAKGGSDQVHRLVVASLPVASVLTIGLGKARESWPADVIRRAAGTAARSLNGTTAAISALGGLPGDDVVAPGVEGVLLGGYRFTAFRTDKTAPKDPGLQSLTVLSTAADAGADAARGVDIAVAVATARDFVNTPPSHLYPAEFADRAKALGEAAGLEVEVLDEQALAEAGFGGVVAVGQGLRAPRGWCG